jgi:hypothetical protein
MGVRDRTRAWMRDECKQSTTTNHPIMMMMFVYNPQSITITITTNHPCCPRRLVAQKGDRMYVAWECALARARG